METNSVTLRNALHLMKNIHNVKYSYITQASGVHNIGRIADGQITPTADSWEKLRAAFPDYIPEVEYIDDHGRLFKLSASDLSDFDLIPKYKARLSGGHGSFEDSDQIEANFAFRKAWVRRKASNKLALFEVVGDSMHPFISDGDVVLVDLNENDPAMIVDGKAYAIREDHTVKVKRLVRQGGSLIIRSQNRQEYPDYEAADDFHLIGRVIWVGHEVK